MSKQNKPVHRNATELVWCWSRTFGHGVCRQAWLIYWCHSLEKSDFIFAGGYQLWGASLSRHGIRCPLLSVLGTSSWDLSEQVCLLHPATALGASALKFPWS